jgi:DNA processing protein
VNACDGCLARGLLLELLAGHLETQRARIEALLALPDDELLDAVGGERADAFAQSLRTADARARRARVERAGLEAVCRCSPLYPRELLELAAPPAALYLTGAVQRLTALLAEPAVAIVGARRASPYGVETARTLASGLVAAGVTVVSGMALGIDGVAHDGALRGVGAARGAGAGGAAGGAGAGRAAGAGGAGGAAGAGGAGGAAGAGGAGGAAGAAGEAGECGAPGQAGRAVGTIAVLPGGADRPYPAGHRRLYERIRAHGLVVSELPPGVQPRRWMFPARNRIIAGLSAITVVVQARTRSGALVTARHAAALGRTVGAVPGPVSSPLSAGPHELIAGGARLITGPQDVLDAIYGPGARTLGDARRREGLSDRDVALLDALQEGHEGAAAFGVAGLGTVEGLEAVAALELAGAIRRGPGGRLLVTTGGD